MKLRKQANLVSLSLVPDWLITNILENGEDWLIKNRHRQELLPFSSCSSFFTCYMKPTWASFCFLLCGNGSSFVIPSIIHSSSILVCEDLDSLELLTYHKIPCATLNNLWLEVPKLSKLTLAIDWAYLQE